MIFRRDDIFNNTLILHNVQIPCTLYCYWYNYYDDIINLKYYLVYMYL